MANTGDTLQFFTNLGSIIKKENDEQSNNKKNSSQSFLDPFFDNGVNKKYMKYTKKQPKSYKIKDENSGGSSEEQDSNEDSKEGPTDVSNTSGDFKRSDWDEDIEDRATKEEVEGQFDDMGSESSSDDDNSGDDDSDVSDEEDDDGEGNRKKKRRRDDDDDEEEDGQEDRKIVFPKNSKPKTPEEVQQLKEKLKQLIEDKRKNRQGKNYVPTEEAPKKDRTEEKKEKKKRKKQMKKRNQSVKEKKEEKEVEGEEKNKKDSIFNVLKKKSDAKPSLDAGNDIEFGTLKVDENGEIKPSYLIKQMEKKGKGKKSKLVKSLKLAEAEKKLIDELKEKEGGEEIVLQKSRERTLALVRGEKLRDDPALLKKSLKNLKSQKKKSYTKIVKNKEAQKRSMEERQKRRDDNIAARNKIKSDYRKGVIKHKEMKKLTKEQRKRKSGFEGSKKKKKQKK